MLPCSYCMRCAGRKKDTGEDDLERLLAREIVILSPNGSDLLLRSGLIVDLSHALFKGGNASR